MPNSNPVRTFTVNVDPVTPQDIVVPVACDMVTIIGLSDTSLFFRGGNGQPEIEIPAGLDRVIGGLTFRLGFSATQLRLTRFAVGDTVGQLRSGSGTGPVILLCQ